MESLAQDIQIAARMLRKHAGFAATAALTLAVGIGATTSMFSVVDTLLLRPLPFPAANRLVILQEGIPKIRPGYMPVSAQDVPDFRRSSHVFEELGGFSSLSMDLSGGGPPQRVSVTRTAASVFRALGAAPAVGRVFSDEEDAEGHNVAILSYGLWQSRFGGSPDVAGRTISLDREPYTVVGVMPAGFEFPLGGMPFVERAQLWVPIAFTKSERDPSLRGDNFNISVLGRLKPHVSVAMADADVMSVAAGIQNQLYPPEFRERSKVALEARVTPLNEMVVGQTRTLVLLLFGAVGLLLMIACANVANLTLARGMDRQKELAVRVALGAGRRRLIRQLLAESAVLGLLGGALGLVVAYVSTRALATLAMQIVPRANEVSIDLAVLLFAFTISILSGIALGLIPAVTTTRADLNEVLNEGGRSDTGARGRRVIRDAFVVAQVALALTLVLGSGLLIRSFVRARETDPGFRRGNTVALEIALPTAQYHTTADAQTFFHRLADQLRAQPGVMAVGTASDEPLSYGWTHLFTAEGHEGEQRGGAPTNVHTLVDGNYFQALGIPLVRGRLFDEDELRGHGDVVLISEGMARRFWPNEDPIGRRLKWGAAGAANPWLTIIGVVGDVKQGPLDETTLPHTYETYAHLCQQPDLAGMCMARIVILRTSSDPSAVAAAAQAAVRQIDPEQAIDRVVAVDQLISASLAPRRLNTFILVAFGIGALALAAIGVYGVISYSVSQQARELGLRLALGAQPSDVMRLVLNRGLRPAVIGVAIGVVASLAATRLMSTLLYGISPTDPLTFGVVGTLLMLIALAACWLPARRAVRNDPVSALRSQ